MKFKLLTLAALTLAVSAFAHAQTDPYLFGLRAKLPSTEKLKDPRISTLFEVWKNADGILLSNGYLEMVFHTATSTSDYVLVVRSVARMSDVNGVLLFQGKGTLTNTHEHTSHEVYAEWYGMDRRKMDSGPLDPPDVFGIHFWRPDTDLNVSARWEFPGFHQVEIYRPGHTLTNPGL